MIVLSDTCLFICLAATAMLLFGVLLYLCVSGLTTADARLKLFIDHDGGADDAIAIFMALLDEKYFKCVEVVALSTVFGNVDENQAFINTQKILNAINRKEVKIYRGESAALNGSVESDHFFGFDGLGDLPNSTDTAYTPIKAQKESAVDALIKYSKEYKGKLVLLTIGSLTNVAVAIQRDPDFVGRLKQLYVGAGNVYDDTPEPEFNVLMDPEAYKIVTDAATPKKVTIIPFSRVIQTLNVSLEWRISILGAIDTSLIKTLNQWERIELNKSTSWTLLDPAAMAVILNPEIATEVLYSKNTVILDGPRRGVVLNDFHAVKEFNARIVYIMNKKAYKNLLYTLFSSDLKMNNVVNPNEPAALYLIKLITNLLNFNVLTLSCIT